METPNASSATTSTVEELQTTIAAHEATIATQKEAHAETQGKLDTALADLARKDQDLTEASNIITGQKDTIKQNQETIDTLQGVKSEVSTVTVDGKVYAITAKSARISKDRVVTAEEIVKDKKLAAELVKKGVGFLELVEKTK